jgi:hypothetical protein
MLGVLVPIVMAIRKQGSQNAGAGVIEDPRQNRLARYY